MKKIKVKIVTRSLYCASQVKSLLKNIGGDDISTEGIVVFGRVPKNAILPLKNQSAQIEFITEITELEENRENLIKTLKNKENQENID